ncbi:hypothetical protein M427DRAFT_147685 [Gonapodya prolifera JEL478]|uniref:TBC-domain-containing protein n=1 Tax=Gonapodya prolifera (strain JEL478) TaxID=1344416 RepID=A0A139A497_GONPJ|nr:hypothetical protein M427DRAFT_147685 [Gonapodya prolifera JEL478]|eukprot:KXS11646.1 hypothetical protein M427DRAFT_147685 [Gonapodya prolifera JEL478]
MHTPILDDFMFGVRRNLKPPDFRREECQLGVLTFSFKQDESDSPKGHSSSSSATSIIIGRAQLLKDLSHPNLCQYVEILKGRRDQIYVVSEHYDKSLLSEVEQSGPIVSIERLRRWTFQILCGLCHLKDHGIAHRNIGTNNILLDPKDNVKISNYGLFHMTVGGQEVNFPIGYPRYLSPELIVSNKRKRSQTSWKQDVWALGILLFELHTGRTFLSDAPTLSDLLTTIASARTHPETGVITNLTDIERWLEESSLDADLRQFAGACLCPDPTRRPDPQSLLSHSFFANIPPAPIPPSHQTTLADDVEIDEDDDGVLTLRFGRDGPVKRLNPGAPGKRSQPSDTDVRVVQPPERLTLREVFYLWKLSGGDVEVELAKQGLGWSPSIYRLPTHVRSESRVHRPAASHDGIKPDSVSAGSLSVNPRPAPVIVEERERELLELYSDRVYTMSLASVRSVLVEAADPNPSQSDSGGTKGSVETMPVNNAYFWFDSVLCPEESGDDVIPQARIPLATRERDMRYQYARMELFARMLLEWPTEKEQLIVEAKVDIPPIYRGKVWAALLDVEGDVNIEYLEIDKETETETDRQLDADIPRCHQYNELLSSPEGHTRLRRVLKAWLAAEQDRLVYWQGLDSLAAVFLSLNFNEEALAFACFQRFVGKFLGNFFVHDNSPVFQEYMCSFQHLLSFHEPALSAYVHSIGLHPDLYAIPWVMTLFAHVFNLEKVYHLYDKFIVGPPSLPLFFGVAILAQAKESIMTREFNECMLLFADLPESVDVDLCLTHALQMCKTTPNSLLPVAVSGGKLNSVDEDGESEGLESIDFLSRPVDVRKQELVGRVLFHDALKMLPHALVLDVRQADDFLSHHVFHSMNVSSLELDSVVTYLRLAAEETTYVLILADEDRSLAAIRLSQQLVSLEFEHVVLVDASFEILSTQAEFIGHLCGCECVSETFTKTTDGASPGDESTIEIEICHCSSAAPKF